MLSTSEPLRCLNCDAVANTPGANFCGKCGVQLPPPDYETPASGERVTPGIPSRKRRILSAALAVSFIGLVFGIGFVLGGTLSGWLAPASQPRQSSQAQALGITQTMPAWVSAPPSHTTGTATNTTSATVAPAIGSAQATVYFSPKGGAQDAIVREMRD